MKHAFPEETVKDIHKAVANYRADVRTWDPFAYIKDVVKFFKDDHRYSFTGNLRSGQYAQYHHEMMASGASGYNCTTVIPSLYLYLEAAGFKPRIVEFFAFRDIQKGEDAAEKCRADHFAIIADVGKSKPYLVDPFWSVLGPILTQDEHSMRIGKVKGFKAKRREFERLDEFTPEQFAQMMEDMRDPAKSLDMLVAGQKAYHYAAFTKIQGGPLHVYYHDENNTVTSRLCASLYGLMDKTIFCHQRLDEEGQTQAIDLEYYLSKDHTWNSLVGEKKIAKIRWQEAHRLRRALNSISRLDRCPRVGTELIKRKHSSQRESLFELTDRLMAQMGVEGMRAIKRQILARTLYETERPRAAYLSSQRDRDRYLFEAREEEIRLIDEITPLERATFFVNWKIQRMSKKRERKIRKRMAAINKKRIKQVLAINSLNNMRAAEKPYYDRLTDMLCFAERMRGTSTEELEQEVVYRGLNPRIGYLALVSDFLQPTQHARKKLLLESFMAPIREKAKARQSSKHVLDT